MQKKIVKEGETHGVVTSNNHKSLPYEQLQIACKISIRLVF